MRYGIAVKLALLLAAVGICASALTGAYSYGVSRSLLVESSQQSLVAATQVLGRRVDTSLEEIARNLQVLANHPSVRRTLKQPDAGLNAQLAELFELMMQANPAYFQIRLITADNFGLEQVRVDRLGSSFINVPEPDLQEKGHFSYVSETLQLPSGTVYMSRITINHERGVYTGAERPSMQLAMPVRDTDGKALGVVVINLDVDGMFALLATDLPPGFRLFLANGQGDILIHPDHSKTFGFDRGRRVLLQDEFAGTRSLISGAANQVVFQQPTTDGLLQPVVMAFVRQPLKLRSEEGQLYVGLAQPLSSVREGAQHLGVLIMVSVLGFGLLGLLGALVLARLVLRPLRQLITAANLFGRGQQVGYLPLERQDEIGELARSFQQMQQQIGEQLGSLHASQEQLKQMAQYDALTELPNRRMLQDRLDLAIARARRHGGCAAVLFIDLDNFKEINDGWGHDAGDAVLVAVAQRLRLSVRDTDTVARLGGDEFVVLLDGPGTERDAALIAAKLIDCLSPGIPFQGGTLRVAASIGISIFPQHGITAPQLLMAADRAMYSVKANGRGGFGFAMLQD